MKFIFAIGVVSQLANFKFCGGAPRRTNNFVIGNNRQLSNPTHGVGGWQHLHDNNGAITNNNTEPKKLSIEISMNTMSGFPDQFRKETEVSSDEEGQGTPVQGTPARNVSEETSSSTATTAPPAWTSLRCSPSTAASTWRRTTR